MGGTCGGGSLEGNLISVSVYKLRWVSLVSPKRVDAQQTIHQLLPTLILKFPSFQTAFSVKMYYVTPQVFACSTNPVRIPNPGFFSVYPRLRGLLYNSKVIIDHCSAAEYSIHPVIISWK